MLEMVFVSDVCKMWSNKTSSDWQWIVVVVADQVSCWNVG